MCLQPAAKLEIVNDILRQLINAAILHPKNLDTLLVVITQKLLRFGWTVQRVASGDFLRDITMRLRDCEYGR